MVRRATLVLCLTVLALTGPSLVAAQNSPPVGRTAREARHWRCDAIQKWTCELPTGCQALKAEIVWTLLDFRDRAYQRCDRFGCDKYSMTVSERGLFTHLNLPDHPDAFMKVGLANYFAEVAVQGVSVTNSLGVCKIQQ
jgi:hypothetical protein